MRGISPPTPGGGRSLLAHRESRNHHRAHPYPGRSDNDYAVLELRAGRSPLYQDSEIEFRRNDQSVVAYDGLGKVRVAGLLGRARGRGRSPNAVPAGARLRPWATCCCSRWE